MQVKRLILQIFGRQNVLFCIFLNLKTSYFVLLYLYKRVVAPDAIRPLTSSLFPLPSYFFLLTYLSHPASVFIPPA